MKKYIYSLLLLIIGSSVSAQTKKTLIIGISGLKPDVLQTASTPNLDALANTNGSISYKSYTGGIPGSDTQHHTSSGPGWCNVLTGVWPREHAVFTNDFNAPDFENYPHFFSRLKSAEPTLKVMSITEWDQLNSVLFEQNSDLAGVTDFYSDCPDSKSVKDLAIDKLKNGDPDVLFLQFDKALLAANTGGYSLSNQTYVRAVETIDGYIGDIISTIKNRPSYAAEEWLTLATSDHGGLPDGTTGGQSMAERTIFMLLSNSKTQTRLIPDYLGHVAVPATVAEHHNITVPPLWNWELGVFSIKVVKPTNFQSYADDINNYVELTWLNSVPTGIIKFEVIRDGKSIAYLPETASNFTDTTPPASLTGTNYQIKMHSIDGVETIYTTTLGSPYPEAVYKFENNLDDSNGKYNATEEGTVSYTSGAKDTAVSFDSSNSAKLGTSLSTQLATSDFSISVWVKAASNNHDRSIISNKDWRKGTRKGWILTTNKGRPKFNFTAENGGRIDITCPSGKIINDGKWHHIVVSVERGKAIDLYFDGIKSVSADISTRTGSTHAGYPIRVAKDGRSGFAYTGSIDNLKIFKYAVTEKYIKALRAEPLKPDAMSGIGNMIDFAGGGQVDLYNPLTVAGNWTVEMWLRPTVDFSTDEDGLKVSSITTGKPSFRLEEWQNSKKLGCTISGAYNHRFNTATPATGTWNHLAYVHKEGKISLYVNGVKDSSTKSDKRDLIINSIAGDGTLFAQLDEFRVWSEARTQHDLINNADSVNPKSPNLEAYYKFNQSTVQHLFDYSGNGNHGWLSNSSTPGAMWKKSSLADQPPSSHYTVLNSKGFDIYWSGFSQSYELDIATDAGFTTFLPGYNSKSISTLNEAVVISDFTADYFIRLRGVNGAVKTANSTTLTVAPALIGAGESFETTIPSNWTIADTNGGTAGYWLSTTKTTAPKYTNHMPPAPDGTNFAYCRYDNKSENQDWLILPAVELPTAGNAVLKFKACTSNASYQEQFKIVASNSVTKDPAECTIELANVSFASDPWKTFEFDIIALSNGKIKHGEAVTLAINYTAKDRRFLAVDQVQLSSSVAKPEPVTLSEVTQTSFKVNWIPQPVCNYRIDVAADKLFSSRLPQWDNKLITGNHTTVSGLSAGTLYYVRVKAEAKDGSLSSPYTTVKSVSTSTIGNNALYLSDEGDDDSISIGRVEEMESLSQFTLETWWKTNANHDDGQNETLFSYKASSHEKFALSTGTVSPGEKSQIWLTLQTAGDDVVAKTASACLPSKGLGQGQWVHIAAVFDGNANGNQNRITLFVNGIKQPLTFTGACPATTTDRPGLMQIGENGFDGTVDEFRFWTVKRTKKQIRDNIYKELDSKNDNIGLLVYYNFNLAGGNALFDYSGNKHHGLLNNRFFTRSSNCWKNSTAVYPSNDSSFAQSNPSVLGEKINTTATGSGAEIKAVKALLKREAVTLIQNSNLNQIFSNDNTGSSRLLANWYSTVTTSAKNLDVDFTFSSSLATRLTARPGDTYELLYSTNDKDYTKIAGVAAPTPSSSPSFSRSATPVTFSNVSLKDGYYTLGLQRSTTPAIGLNFSKTVKDGKLYLIWTVEEEIGISKYTIEKLTSNGWVTVYTTQKINGGPYTFIDQNGDLDTQYRLLTYDNYGIKTTTSVNSPQSNIYLSLQKGWNLLSVPLKNADISRLKMQCSLLWGWENGKYERLNNLEPYAGFWAYSNKEVTLLVTGDSPEETDWTRKLTLGWNLLGPYSNTRKPDAIDNAFSWTNSYNSLLKDDLLMRGVGYWLFLSRQ